jgi:hypothetical protein
MLQLSRAVDRSERIMTPEELALVLRLSGGMARR